MSNLFRLKKAKISFGDSWDIYADGVKVGYIKGVPLYLIGDTYSLFSTNDNLVSSESENFKVINNTANVYDYNNIQTGYISQEIISLLHKFKIYENSALVGTAEQNSLSDLMLTLRTLTETRNGMFPALLCHLVLRSHAMILIMFQE